MVKNTWPAPDRPPTDMTPWEYLEAWGLSPLSKEYGGLGWIQAQMQIRWPGPYRVLQIRPNRGWATRYGLVFDSDLEETMFRLRWS